MEQPRSRTVSVSISNVGGGGGGGGGGAENSLTDPLVGQGWQMVGNRGGERSFFLRRCWVAERSRCPQNSAEHHSLQHGGEAYRAGSCSSVFTRGAFSQATRQVALRPAPM